MPQKTQLAVGLDVGASRTRCVICALDGEYIRYLGHGLAISAGWARGRLADQEAVSELEKAANTDGDGMLHYNLFRLYRKVGRKEDAQRALQISNELRSKNPGSPANAEQAASESEHVKD